MKDKTIYLKKIGANIKAIRKQKQLEVKEVAPALGITPQAYGAIENGRVDLNITRLLDIAQYFEVTFENILHTKEGDTFSYTSQNNSGGYHLQNHGTMNITYENSRNYFKNDITQLK